MPASCQILFSLILLRALPHETLLYIIDTIFSFLFWLCWVLNRSGKNCFLEHGKTFRLRNFHKIVGKLLIMIFALFYLFFILWDTVHTQLKKSARMQTIFDTVLIGPTHENITLQELLILFYRASVFVKSYIIVQFYKSNYHSSFIVIGMSSWWAVRK